VAVDLLQIETLQIGRSRVIQSHRFPQVAADAVQVQAQYPGGGVGAGAELAQ
jgi:hypothetical protein